MVMEYPGFKALALAAKDCKGNAFSVIQGTNGSIRCDCPPNLMGKVKLELNDGTVEEFDDGMQNKRLIPEFTAFMNAINTNDPDFCYEMLEKTVAVSEVQTDARLSAGIRFAADE